MGRRQLVLTVGPGLALVGEGGPGIGVAGRVDVREVRRPLGEGLVEPQVVPPRHRDEVAEPHVGELVEDRVRALLVGGVGHPGAEHHVLEERDAASILHSAGIELGDEELVVLAEGVGGLELLLEECESLLRQLEDVVRIEVLGKRLPAEDAHRVGAVRAHVLVANLVIRPRDEGGDVGRHSRGRGELPAGDSLGHG